MSDAGRRRDEAAEWQRDMDAWAQKRGEVLRHCPPEWLSVVADMVNGHIKTAHLEALLDLFAYKRKTEAWLLDFSEHPTALPA